MEKHRIPEVAVIGLVLLTCAEARLGLADETGATPADASGQRSARQQSDRETASAMDSDGPSEGGDSEPVNKLPSRAKGKLNTREKEADGTEASDRFQADTVIKSKYHLDGKPLEVDPD